MARKPIAMATATELAVFATVHLGMEKVRAQQGIEHLKTLLKSAQWLHDYIEVPDPEGPGIQRRDPNLFAQDGDDPFERRRMAVIRIAVDEKPGGDQPVPAAPNGRLMFIPRNQEARVPYEFAEVLLHATKYVYDTDQDSKIIGRREVPEYPVVVIPEPEFPGWNMTPDERREAVTDGVLRLSEDGRSLEYTGKKQPLTKPLKRLVQVVEAA